MALPVWMLPNKLMALLALVFHQMMDNEIKTASIYRQPMQY